MNNLDKAFQAILLGPKLKVFDYEFNIKPAYISKMGNQTVVQGQISHHLSFRFDDQVFYRFVKEDEVIKNLEIKIDRGGWTKITAPIGVIIAQSSGFQNIRHASRTSKGIETIQAIYKQRRSLSSNSVFLAYNALQKLFKSTT